MQFTTVWLGMRAEALNRAGPGPSPTRSTVPAPTTFALLSVVEAKAARDADIARRPTRSIETPNASSGVAKDFLREDLIMTPF
jgi:hypothetical protein